MDVIRGACSVRRAGREASIDRWADDSAVGRGRGGRRPGRAGLCARSERAGAAGAGAGGERPRRWPDADRPGGGVCGGQGLPGLQHRLPAGTRSSSAPGAAAAGVHIGVPRARRRTATAVRRPHAHTAAGLACRKRSAGRPARSGRAGRTDRLRRAGPRSAGTAPQRHLHAAGADRGGLHQGFRGTVLPSLPVRRVPGGGSRDLRQVLPPAVAEHGTRHALPARDGRGGRTRTAGVHAATGDSRPGVARDGPHRRGRPS